MKRPQILVVDNETRMFEELRDRLIDRGYEIPPMVASGEDAVRQARDLRPDLILMAMRPGGKMSGVEAVIEMKRQNLDVPVLYVTSGADDELLERAKLTEPLGFVPKPLHFEEVRSAVEVALYNSGIQRKLRESEERFRKLFEQANDAVFIHNIAGIVLDLNPRACELSGYTKEQCVQAPLERFFLTEEPGGLQKILRQLAEQKALRFETPLRRAYGSLVHVEVNARVLEETGGVVQAILRDISERKRMEEELKTSQANLVALIQNTDLIIVSFDRKKRVVVFNQAAAQMFRDAFAIELQTGRSVLENFSVEQRMWWNACYDRVLHGERFVKEFTHYFPDRQARYYEISFNPILLGSRIVGFSKVAREVTTEKQTNKVLQESEARYKSLFHDNHSVMLLIDPNTGVIIEANAAACAYYGYSSKEFSQKNIQMINLLSEEEIFQEMQRARAERRKYFLFQHCLASGEVRDVEVYSGPIKLHGKLLLYSIIHDVTERRQAEIERARTAEALKKAYHELQTTQQELVRSETLAALGEVAAGIAHEIRNPLSNISASAQYCLRKERSPEQLRKYLHMIQRNAERANIIIKELLDFAKPQTLMFRNADLGSVVERACFLVERERMRRNIRLDVQIVPDLPSVSIDATRMEQVCINCMSNALEAMVDGGTLSVTLRRQDNDMILQIGDTGKGIAPHDCEKIFTPFYTSKPEGIGLGLSVTRRIVEAHHGTIEVESDVGHGTQVMIRIPLAFKGATA